MMRLLNDDEILATIDDPSNFVITTGGGLRAEEAEKIELELEEEVDKKR